MSNWLKINQAGDTIVEVMVATTILALVMSVSFVSANRSLQVGTDAANRKQALQYAQQQIERLRVLVNNGSLNTSPSAYDTDSGIPTTRAFCVGTAQDPNNPDGTIYKIVDTSADDCSPGPFTESITYDSSTRTFATNVSWAASSSSNTDQLTLYYQDPE